MKKISTIVFTISVALLFCSCDGHFSFSKVKNAIKTVELIADIQKEFSESASKKDNENNKAEAFEDGFILVAPLKKTPEQVLKRTGYVVSYNKVNKIPNWVGWRLTSNHSNGNFSRSGIKFQEDMDVPSPRATNWDYYNSGYSRGHMCPSGDNKWSREAQEDCFLFTNMCPQDFNLNAGDWNEMEMQCRSWARTYGDIYIVCGPILYKGKHKIIGQNKVVVPEAFFKVVLCLKGKPKAIGFIYKNKSGDRPKGDYVNSIDEVERITGMDFFPSLPNDVETKVEQKASLSEWD